MTSSRSRTRVLVALSTAALVGTLAACTPAADPVVNAGSQQLTVAVPTVSPPYNASSQASGALRVTSNVFDPLIVWDPETDTYRPGLATEWEQVSETELDLTIRQDVEFHDGTPMTAEDVAFTLSESRLWGAEALEPTTLADTFAAVDVLDAQTVRITTSQPDPALVQRLATSIGFVVPEALIESEGIEAFGLHPVGTGPYEVDAVAPGERVELVANDDYWGEETPYASLTFVEVPEVSARVSGLATGEYDIATNLPPDQTAAVEANGQSVSEVAANNVVMLGFMSGRADSPVGDPLVRRAMELALDRQEIASSLWGDGVEVPDGFDLPVFGDFYDGGSAAEQDVAEAEDLLAESSYDGEPITVRWISGYYTNLDRALEVMQEMWADAGITVNLEGVADFTLLDIPTSDLYATSSNIAFNDPVSPLWTDWLSPASRYISEGRGTISTELAAAGAELATSLDDAERAAAYDTAVSLWREELPALTVWQPLEILGARTGIDVQPDPRYWLRLTASASE